MMFLCNKCPKIFLDKKQLAYHQRYHVMVESPCHQRLHYGGITLVINLFKEKNI